MFYYWAYMRNCSYLYGTQGSLLVEISSWVREMLLYLFISFTYVKYMQLAFCDYPFRLIL